MFFFIFLSIPWDIIGWIGATGIGWTGVTGTTMTGLEVVGFTGIIVDAGESVGSCAVKGQFIF